MSFFSPNYANLVALPIKAFTGKSKKLPSVGIEPRTSESLLQKQKRISEMNLISFKFCTWIVIWISKRFRLTTKCLHCAAIKALGQKFRGSGFYPHWKSFLGWIRCSCLCKPFLTLSTLYNLIKTRIWQAWLIWRIREEQIKTSTNRVNTFLCEGHTIHDKFQISTYLFVLHFLLLSFLQSTFYYQLTAYLLHFYNFNSCFQLNLSKAASFLMISNFDKSLKSISYGCQLPLKLINFNKYRKRYNSHCISNTSFVIKVKRIMSKKEES